MEKSLRPYIGLRGRRYYAFWYDPAHQRTQRRSLKTTYAGEAVRAFKALFPQEAGRLQFPRSGPYSVAEAIDDYLIEHVETDCADPERQKTASGHLKRFFGEIPLEDIDIPQSRAYAVARREGVIGGGKRRRNRRGADSTIRRELVVLMAVANHALKWKRIKVKPTIEFPRERRLGQVRDLDGGETALDGEAAFFTRAQIDRLIEKAGQVDDDPRHELQRFIKLCYFTGARRRSIENLTAGQVSLARRKISLASPGKPQTKKRQPIVPIFEEVVDDLAALTRGRGRQDRLFRPRSFYRDFTMLCRKLGFSQPFNPHMLRHSRASHLLQDGTSIYDVAKLLGDTVATVERNYGHHRPDELRQAIEGRGLNRRSVASILDQLQTLLARLPPDV